MATAQRRSPMRERFREQVREDVKAVALTQLAAGGAQAISLNAIAKELGVSGPALYRYYANRDELLTELVVEAYHDLRDALDRAATATATAATRLPRPAARMRELGHAYRAWAREHPHRYELLWRPPFPGYDAHAAPISEAAGSIMVPVLGVLDGDEADDVRYVVSVWTCLHGLVSLELGGAYAAVRVDADALFDEELGAVTDRYPGRPDGR